MKIKWRMILAVVNAIYAIAYEACKKKSGLQLSESKVEAKGYTMKDKNQISN